jgi:hypothetical protein
VNVLAMPYGLAVSVIKGRELLMNEARAAVESRGPDVGSGTSARIDSLDSLRSFLGQTQTVTSRLEGAADLDKFVNKGR